MPCLHIERQESISMGRKHFDKRMKEMQDREKVQNRMSIFKKFVFGGIVALTIGTSVLIYQDNGHKQAQYSLNQTHATFDDAKTNPSSRQKYIDELVAGQNIPNCSGVIYDNDGSKIIAFFEETFKSRSQEDRMMIGGQYNAYRGGNYDVKTPDVLNTAGRGESIPIYVGRQIFDDPEFSYLTGEDVKHILLAHEPEHCRQHAKGLDYISTEKVLNGVEKGEIRQETLYYVFEYDAYCSDLPRAMNGEFKVSSTYLNKCKKDFILTGQGLSLAWKSASPLEQELIEKVHEQASKVPELRDVSVK